VSWGVSVLIYRLKNYDKRDLATEIS
jgi:hypothetical protein